MADNPSFATGTTAGLTRLDGTHGSNIYREHGLPQWTLNYTVAGRGKFKGRGTSFLASPGDLVLILPGVLNDYGIEPELRQWTHLWSVFTPVQAWVDALNWEQALPGMLTTRVEDSSLRDTIERQFRLLIHFAQTPIRVHADACLSMLHCLLTLSRKPHPEGNKNVVDERIQSALAYVCEHLPNDLSLAVLARVARLSVSRFAHLFSEQTALTPMQYVEQQRIRRACELLLMSNYRVSQVSTASGFQDPVYFARVFRKNRGLSPSAFRKKLATGEPLPR